MPSLRKWGKSVKTKGGGSGGRYINNKTWKDDGELIFWLHPQSSLADRETLLLWVPVTTENGEKKLTMTRRFYQGENDITERFKNWLADQDDIDEDDIVLKVKHGKESKSWKKGEILGLKGYDWRQKAIDPNIESLMSVIPHEDPANKILAVPVTCGQKIWKRIENQMSDLGEEEGNPQENPYALKVTYDAKARTGKYDAEICMVKLTDEVEACFEAKPHDIDAECDPDREEVDDDYGTTADILRAMCVVECDIWDMEEEEVDEGDDEEEGEEEGDEEEGEEAEGVEAGEAEEDEWYSFEDGTVACFVGIKGRGKSKKAVFEDEDGEEYKLSLDTVVWPYEEEEDEEEEGDEEEDGDEGDDEEVLVKDCEPGEVYIDADGDELTFVKWDKKKKQGIFEDADEDQFPLDGEDIVKKK